MPLKTMLVRSPRRDLAGDRRGHPSTPAGSRPSAPLRPSAAPWTRSTRASAGIVSPSSTRMMSPGTSVGGRNAASASPSRITCACAAAICRKRRDGRFRARLLHVAHDRVQQHDRADGDGFVRQRRVALVQPEAGRNRRRDQQQDDQHVLELREELPPARNCLARRAARSRRNVRGVLRTSSPPRPRRASVFRSERTSSAGR